MSYRLLAVCVTASAVLVACSPSTDQADVAADIEATATAADSAPPPPATTQDPAFVPRPIEAGVPFVTPEGLSILAHEFGNGSLATNGRPVTVHYTGWLFDETAQDNKGKVFDSSVERDTPFRFTLGRGQVIRGWDEGVLGMKVGGKRTLTIPHAMAYGRRGYPGVIPPSATLIFDVELLGVE